MTPRLIFTSGTTGQGRTRLDVYGTTDSTVTFEIHTLSQVLPHTLTEDERATLTLALQGPGYLTEGEAQELREKAHEAALADRKLRDYGFTAGSLLARVAALCGKQGRHEAEKADMRRQWKAFRSEIHEMLAETEPPLTGELRDRIAEVCGREEKQAAEADRLRALVIEVACRGDVVLAFDGPGGKPRLPAGPSEEALADDIKLSNKAVVEAVDQALRDAGYVEGPAAKRVRKIVEQVTRLVAALDEERQRAAKAEGALAISRAAHEQSRKSLLDSIRDVEAERDEARAEAERLSEMVLAGEGEPKAAADGEAELDRIFNEAGFTKGTVQSRAHEIVGKLRAMPRHATLEAMEAALRRTEASEAATRERMARLGDELLARQKEVHVLREIHQKAPAELDEYLDANGGTEGTLLMRVQAVVEAKQKRIHALEHTAHVDKALLKNTNALARALSIPAGKTIDDVPLKAVERIADLSERADALAERLRKVEAHCEDVAKAAYGVRPCMSLTFTTYQQLIDRVRDLYDQTDGKEAPPLVASVRALGAALDVREGTRLEDVAGIAIEQLAKAREAIAERDAAAEHLRTLGETFADQGYSLNAPDVIEMLAHARIGRALRDLDDQIIRLRKRGPCSTMSFGFSPGDVARVVLTEVSEVMAEEPRSVEAKREAADVLAGALHLVKAHGGLLYDTLTSEAERLLDRLDWMDAGETWKGAKERLAKGERAPRVVEWPKPSCSTCVHCTATAASKHLSACHHPSLDAPKVFVGKDFDERPSWCPGFEPSAGPMVRGQAAQAEMREAQAAEARRRAQDSSNPMDGAYFEREAQRLEARAEEHRADARLVPRKDPPTSIKAPAGVTVTPHGVIVDPERFSGTVRNVGHGVAEVNGVTVRAGDVTPASLVEALRLDAEARPLAVLARAAAAAPGALSAAAWANESQVTLLVLVDEWRYDDGTIRDIAKGMDAHGGNVSAEVTRSAKTYRDLVAKARAKFTVHEEPANGAALHEAEEPAPGALEQRIMARVADALAKAKAEQATMGPLPSLTRIAVAVDEWTEAEAVRRNAAETFSSWAMVELMGHRVLVGLISGDGRSLLVEDDETETTRRVDLGAGVYATTYLRDEDEARLVRHNLAHQRRLSPPIDPALLEPREPVAPERASAPAGSWWLKEEDIGGLICGLRSPSDATIAYVEHGKDDIRLLAFGRVPPEMAEAARAECIRLRGDLLDDLPF